MFIDDVMNKYPGIPKPEAVFKIQNVSDYYYKVEPNGVINYEKDVINYAIPFDKTWFEFRTSTTVVIDNKWYYPPSLQVGVYAINVANELKLGDKNPYNCIDMNLFILSGKNIVIVGSKKFLVDTCFNYVGHKISPVEGEHISPEMINTDLTKQFGMSNNDIQSCFGMLNPVLLTLNFLHCKNVTQVQNILNKESRKARQKRNKPYFEKYYTLAIEPMKKTLNTEGEAQSKGLAHALHICRGHFKDYTEKGLFGRIKGTFWWPATLRGNEEIGKIKKDYEIKVTNGG